MITLGSTTPSTAQAGGAGRMFAQSVVLTGAPAGSYFTKIRAKMSNQSGGSQSARMFVYSGTTLIDWLAFTVTTSAAVATIFEVTLTGAVVISDGTFRIGVQAASADTNFYITTGTADTTHFTSTTTYGSAPPNPWTPGSTFAWSMAFEADVFTPAAAPAFVPKIIVVA